MCTEYIIQFSLSLYKKFQVNHGQQFKMGGKLHMKGRFHYILSVRNKSINDSLLKRPSLNTEKVLNLILKSHIHRTFSI